MNNKRNKSIVIIISIIVLILCGVFFLNNKEKSNINDVNNTLRSEGKESFEPQSIDFNTNSKYKLNIISTYNDNEAYHPKVLSFKEGWNGYKYWMSYTPYPQGDDLKENPHIAVSNDLINWKTLCNLDTPADVRPQLRYNSDSHIVYNDKLNRLECYWRYVDDVENKAIIYRRTTMDGINWSEKEVAVLNEPRSKVDCVSPAIIFEDGLYKMWYVDKNNVIKYRISEDGLNWSKATKINLAYEEDVKSWHLDVIHTEKGYEMLVVSFKSWKLRNDMNLYYTVSPDGINWETAKIIMKPTIETNNWDNKGIYRSSFIYEDGIYYIYYSGTDKDMHHGIGLVYGKDIFNLNQITTDYTNLEEVEVLKENLNLYRNSK